MKNDLIDRATLPNVRIEIPKRLDDETIRIIEGLVKAFKTVIDSAPAVDAVEVVRCKDCEAYGSSPYNHPRSGFCIIAAAHVDPKHYCAYGKRRKKYENA